MAAVFRLTHVEMIWLYEYYFIAVNYINICVIKYLFYLIFVQKFKYYGSSHMKKVNLLICISW